MDDIAQMVSKGHDMDDDRYVIASAQDGSAIQVTRCNDCRALITEADAQAHADWHARARVNTITTT